MLTWYQLVSLGIIDELGDPELVHYFLKILRPLRRDFLEEEARIFHGGMRINKEERWRKTCARTLSMRKKFCEMHAAVPITCTLPFNGDMWRRSCNMMKSIRYFRETFVREEKYTNDIRNS